MIVSATSVTGTFDGLADGDIVNVHGQSFVIRYQADRVELVPAFALEASIDGNGDLVIIDVLGRNNSLSVQLVQDSGSVYLEVRDANQHFAQAPLGWTLSSDGRAIRALNGTFANAILLQAGTGNDSVVIDLSLGNPIPAGGISYLGGENSGDNDSLEVTGYALNSADGVADVSVVHTGAESGSINLLGLGTIQFGQIEPLTLSGSAADLEITLPAGAESVTLGDDGATQDTNGNTANTSALYDASAPYSFEFHRVYQPEQLADHSSRQRRR